MTTSGVSIAGPPGAMVAQRSARWISDAELERATAEIGAPSQTAFLGDRSFLRVAVPASSKLGLASSVRTVASSVRTETHAQISTTKRKLAQGVGRISERRQPGLHG
jgi:hypothetical protein